MRGTEGGGGFGRWWGRMGLGGWGGRRNRHRGGAGAGAEMAGPGAGAAWAGFSLNDLGPGAGGRVWRLHGGGAIRQRLLDLGLLPGAEILVIRSAPLFDPIEIKVGDAFLTLRRAEAMLIEMRHD